MMYVVCLHVATCDRDRLCEYSSKYIVAYVTFSMLEAHGTFYAISKPSSFIYNYERCDLNSYTVCTRVILSVLDEASHCIVGTES